MGDAAYLVDLDDGPPCSPLHDAGQVLRLPLWSTDTVVFPGERVPLRVGEATPPAAA